MKRTMILSTALALAVLLASCGGSTDTTTATPESTTPASASVESTAPESASAETAAPTATETPEETAESAVTGLTESATSRPANENGDVFLKYTLEGDAQLGDKYIADVTLYDLGADKVVVRYSLADEPSAGVEGEFQPEGYEQRLVSYDLATGETTNEVLLPGDDMENGDYIYAYQERVGSLLWNRQVEGETLTATAYNEEMEPVVTFQTPAGVDAYGVFSQDGTAYYVCQNGTIMRYATDGSGNVDQLTLGQHYAVSSLAGVFADGEGGSYAKVYGMAGDLYQYDGVVSLTTGEVVYLSRNSNFSFYINQGELVGEYYDFEDPESPVTQMIVCRDGTPMTYSWTESGFLSYEVLSNGNLLFYYTQYPEDDATKAQLCMGLYDTSTGTMLSSTSLTLDSDYLWPSNLVVSQQAANELSFSVINRAGDTLFYTWEYGGTNHEMDSMTVTATVLPDEMKPDIDDQWDPTQMTPGTCPDELSDLRQRADALEETYGVVIHISDECCNYLGGYVVMPQSDYNTVDTALTLLEQQMEEYPQDFFRQFQSGWFNGVEIDLAGTLMGRSEDVLDYAGGFQMENDGMLLMVLDITNPEDILTNFHHELSHAIEMQINYSDTPLDGVAWSELNPDSSVYGDCYTYSYSDGVNEEMEQFLYDWEDPEDAYFIDQYSLTYPTEDRARLFEYVMCPSYSWIDLSETPHLQEKLNYFASCIREVFDTTGWEDVRWEQYMDAE